MSNFPSSPLAGYAAAVGGGVLLGLTGAVVSTSRLPIAGVNLPWGLLLVLATIAACARAAAYALESRGAALAVALGWVIPTVAFASFAPGHDLMLVALPRTYVYVIAGFSLAMIAAVWPLPRPEHRPATD
ncbi:MAG: DUF6113 family protein [Actinomycetes bacterium]|jgi:hypothetical protein